MIADGATLDRRRLHEHLVPGDRHLSVGPGNFLGNAVAYPSGERVGETASSPPRRWCPLDGPGSGEASGCSGSPSFEIPRSLTKGRPLRLAQDRGRVPQHRLAAKNRHNLATMGLFLARAVGALSTHVDAAER